MTGGIPSFCFRGARECADRADACRRARRAVCLGLATTFVLWSCPARSHAAVLEGKSLPEELKKGGTTFVLHGKGVLKVGFVFKVYAAALYLGEDVEASSVMDDVPKRLEIHFLHTTPKRHMIETANETLRENLTDAEWEAVSARVERLHAAYRDGRKGGVAALTYIPGWGTELAFDGRSVVRLQGADFARAYFSVWLGRKPSSRSLKAQLLPDRDERA